MVHLFPIVSNGTYALLPSKFGSQSEEVVDRCNQLFLSNDNIN